MNTHIYKTILKEANTISSKKHTKKKNSVAFPIEYPKWSHPFYIGWSDHNTEIFWPHQQGLYSARSFPIAHLHETTKRELLTPPCVATSFHCFPLYVCPLQQVSFNNAAAETCSFRCDVDKWAITGAIFTCPICGRHDPRLALLILNGRCKSCGCQYRRLWRRHGSFWHVIHHRFHSAATAVSPSPSRRPLTRLRTHQQDDQISLRDKRQPSSFTDKAEDKKLHLFYTSYVPQWHLYQ